MRTKCRLLGCCAAAASLFPMSHAHAGAFAVRTQSAYGQGSSFAGIAAGGSLSSMFWNPANLTDVRRGEIEAVGTGIFPDVDVKLDPVPPLGFRRFRRRQHCGEQVRPGRLRGLQAA